MRSIKTCAAILLFSIVSFIASAQDVVLISDGNFVRGTIQGTDYASVAMKKDDGTVALFNAKDIKEFVWNGEAFVSKPIVIKKKMEHRFFRLLEQGAVNLYSIGGSTGVEQPKPKRAKVRPQIGIGGGTGGFGGMGGGVGISFGGGGRSENDGQPARVMPTAYFIERFGSGPMLELPVEGGNSEGKNTQIRNALLQKLTNDEDLAERIKATETFDAKLIRAFVTAYNDMKK